MVFRSNKKMYIVTNFERKIWSKYKKELKVFSAQKKRTNLDTTPSYLHFSSKERIKRNFILHIC